MKDTHRHQHYALDETGHLIYVHDLKSKASVKFYCPYCGQEMISKCGKLRDWHFAHKTDAQKCSYDKYLHSLAIHKISEWYNKSEHIFLRFVTTRRCDKFYTCKWRLEDDFCHENSMSTPFDLKTRFPIGKEETAYSYNDEKFIPDILCEDIKGKASPIFIEIYVTHKCEDKKINSGIRIIEFKIKSEEDIMTITSSQILKRSELVSFYNFHPTDEVGNDFFINMQKFVLFPSKKYHIDKSNFTCRNYDKIRRGVYEIAIPYDDCTPAFIWVGGFYVVALAKAMYDKYVCKDCNLCKYHKITGFMGDHICALYKKYGTQRLCKDNNANECGMFRLDTDLYRIAIEEFDRYSKMNYVDVWKK